MLAQCTARIFMAKQPTLAQDRQYFIEEHIKALGERWRHHIETIGGATAEPLLNQVGNLHRRTDRHPMPTSTGQAIDQLAQRRLLTVDDVDDQLEATGLALATVEIDQVAPPMVSM